MFAALLVTTLPACTGAPTPIGAPALTREAAPPMERFTRLVGGDWTVTFASGETAAHAWMWGPGGYSVMQMASSSEGPTNEWAGELLYWHPGRRAVCVLSLHGDIPGVGRGVAEGTVWAEGEVDVSLAALSQPPGQRTVGTRRTFATPDSYREELLEDTGNGLQPLNRWDFVRVRDRVIAPSSGAPAAAVTLPKYLAHFAPFLGVAWGAKGEIEDRGSDRAFHTLSTVEFLPSLEVLRVRVRAAEQPGWSGHLIDAYVYRHVATNDLRCLALTRWGGVVEGAISVLEDGALLADLRAYEAEGTEPMVLRVSREADGSIRTQLSSGTYGSTLRHRADVLHRPPTT